MTTATQNQNNATATKENLKSEINNAKLSIADAANEAGAKVKDFISKSSVQFTDTRKVAEKSISENPLRSVALAMLGGAVIAALLRR